MMISADATIKEVLRLSLEKKSGCLPVVQGHTLVGIITETNPLRYVVDLPE